MSRPLLLPASSIPQAPASCAPLTRRLLLSSVAVALACTTNPLVPPPAQANPLSSAAAAAAGRAVPPLPFSSTPYSQSQSLQLGLDNIGKIRACPAANPGCVSTNPRVGASSSVASPLLIPEATSGKAAVDSLRQAIIKTQKSVSFKVDQDTPYGHYIQAEVDGGFGRDAMEFLVKEEAGVVAYRCVATKVTFVYPFTTAVGDSRGQKQRIAAVSEELGWYAPDITQSSVDDWWSADHDGF